MKKIFCLLTALLLLCFYGCNRAAEDHSAKNNTYDDIAGKNSEELILPNAMRSNLNLNACFSDLSNNIDLQVIEMLGNYYYGYDTAQSANGLVDSYALADNTGEQTALQYENGTQNWSVGSGSQIVMQDRYLYEWLCFSQSEADGFPLYDVRLIRTDGQTGKVEIADRVEQASPFIYLCKVDDEHFLSFGTAQAPSNSTEYAVLSTAVLYNVNGENQQIITELFENNENWANSRGTLLEFFAAKDGEIYAYGRKNIEGECHYFLYHYDLSGNLLDTTELKGFDKIIGEEQPIDFHLVGDYIALRTYESLTNAICKIGENGTELIMKGVQNQAQYAVSGQYIVFIENNVDVDSAQIKEGDFPLYVLDTENYRLEAGTFSIPLKNPYFVQLHALSNDSIVLSYCEETYDPENVRQFLLDRKNIIKMVE